MSSGWPHSEDPAGYSDPEYRSGGYRYTSPQSPAGAQGAHPYAAFGAEYGDAADTGTYRQPGYTGPGYPGSGQIERAYPSDADSYHGADLYKQPWDYDQPLRYEGEEDSYPAAGGYWQPAFEPSAYNGSDYSMPGVNGPGYDLSGIIGTNDFEAIDYDEPSYGRLSYDDPRYEGTQGYSGPRPGFDETRFDVPRFDERLDNLWQAGEDVRRDGGPAGFGNDGYGDSRTRSVSPSAFDRGRSTRAAQTRYDMQALVEPGDSTRFDVPVFDETRLDDLRALTPGTGLRTSGTALLAPPDSQPRSWSEDTSLDHFADLDLTDEPVPAAFTRTAERPQRDDTARRTGGRRRGRSGDRRQWMALGAIAVVAAGAIGGVLMKYVFSGPSGPAHQVVAPQTVDGFSRSANLEKQLQVGTEAQKVARASSGQASDVVSAVYQQGSITPGSNAQIFMFVGGKLAGADPAASIANFEQTYQPAATVSAGSLGGEAACTETHLNGQSASMCVWFDNDTFGTVVSPTMTTAKLAATMNAVRPSLELYAK